MHCVNKLKVVRLDMILSVFHFQVAKITEVCRESVTSPASKMVQDVGMV